MTDNCSSLEVAVGGSVLFAVPAVHFRVAFAEEVNRLCRDPLHRPDAIVVELGPITTAAVYSWLTDLGIGPAQRNRLPVMLGMVKPNRYLKPSVRARALALQRATDTPLADLPAEVLQRELGYARFLTLMLSPTDSIVEAIRCGCELGVPVYGVDLEDMAAPQEESVLIEDSSLACGRVAEYIAGNQAFGQGCDAEIDPRRETAMAARLKALLGRHSRILFTCGMAHWRRVCARLREPSLQPALIDARPPDASAFRPFERTIVDPHIAARYLDRFPVVAKLYERRRSHPLLGGPGALGNPHNPQSLHRRLLRKVYQRYFTSDQREAWRVEKRRDWSTAPAFEQLVDAQSRLNMHSLPTFADIYSSARTTMSREFCTVLGQALMAFPWLKPGECEIDTSLEPARRGASDDMVVIQRGGRSDGETFPLKTIPGQESIEDPVSDVPLDLPDPRHEPGRFRKDTVLAYSHYSWVPWDNLVNALSWAAIRHAGRREYTRHTEAFSGQLLEGIDVKPTLRSQARGEQKLFVHNSRLRPAAAPFDPTEGLPAIWLFDADPKESNCEHQCYHQSLGLTLPYARDPSLFRRQARENGNSAVAMVAFGKDNHDDPVLGHSQVHVHRFDLRGAVLFIPLFPRYRQFARWFERTHFTGIPLSGFGCWQSLKAAAIAEIERHLGAPPTSLRWQDLLVCAAIPYSAQSVTIVAPPAFELAPVVHQFAAHRGKRLQMTSLDRFPRRYVRRIRTNYMVGGRFDLETDYMVYDAGAEKVLGEPLDRYLNLVPRQWREFGLD